MMDESFAHQWESLQKKGDITTAELRKLSRQIAYSFLDSYLKDFSLHWEYIDLLCRMSTAFSNPESNAPASKALFSVIVESLCDEFEELQAQAYYQVMARVISHCRCLPNGRDFDARLKDFGIKTEQDLLDRVEDVRKNGRFLHQRQGLKKVLILSRVTVGADVAITSVIVQRVQAAFPQAEIVLMGPEKMKDVFAGHPGLRFRCLPYPRHGNLLERLSTWTRVLGIIEDETALLARGQAVVFDPDSRLSQLGMLPLTSSKHYFYFDSRTNQDQGHSLSMPELVNAWLDRVLDNKQFAYPQVWLAPDIRKQAKEWLQNFKGTPARKIICINFGVGNNQRKRISLDFEKELLLTLLRKEDALIILDKGIDLEKQENEWILKEIAKQGYDVQHGHFQSEETIKVHKGIIGMEAKIDEISSLIAFSDEFIGYDSACQHIAAALNTPCTTIFAGSNNMKFIRRWCAFGQNSSHMIHIDTLNDPDSVDLEGVLERIMHQRRSARLSGTTV